MLFQFKMREAVDCEITPTEIGKRCPSWFYMTDSDYFIDLKDVKLFENSKESLEKYPLMSRFFNYQYTRFLVDLFHELPRIACSIPIDIFAHIDTLDKSELLLDRIFNEEKFTATQKAIENNIYENLINVGYFIQLPSNISCRFFHVNNEIILRYDVSGHDEDGTPWWTATKGEYRLSYQDFIAEIDDLLNRFFARMDRQVEDVIKFFTLEEGRKFKYCC